ncbi:MAG: metallophosphoesterase family protein [Planctomycetes bacterium]|nr:metallophosphoesterase family protein [Planctomycetota bacterium]
MLQAIIADVHSNIEAFTAVLDDVRAQGITEIISLGDLVGYGPNPVECIVKSLENNIINLYGNHELALFKDKTNFNPTAQRAINWTKEVINYNKRHPQVKHFFDSLQYEYKRDGVIYTHGSPRGEIDEYVIKKDDFFNLTPEVKASLKYNFELVETIGFVGHTHIPYICTSDFYLVHPEWQNYETYPLLLGTKTLINPGSVGQPRDGDPRASYAIFDGTNVIHRRVVYDIEKTVATMQSLMTLDKSLWIRLRKGT